jgi:hypothetical protein
VLEELHALRRIAARCRKARGWLGRSLDHKFGDMKEADLRHRVEADVNVGPRRDAGSRLRSQDMDLRKPLHGLL